MFWRIATSSQDQQQSAEYAAAGRQSVVTLMSLDYNKAQEDVQRIIDNSIGQFKDDFQNQSADFVKVAQESKVITEVTVNSVAVESMSDDSAVVLVAASSRVTNSAGANQEPRSWRLVRGSAARRRADQNVESRVRAVTTDDNETNVDVAETAVDEAAIAELAEPETPDPLPGADFQDSTRSGRRRLRHRRHRPAGRGAGRLGGRGRHGCTSASTARISRSTRRCPRPRSTPRPTEPSRCCRTPRTASTRTSRQPSPT